MSALIANEPDILRTVMAKQIVGSFAEGQAVAPGVHTRRTEQVLPGTLRPAAYMGKTSACIERLIADDKRLQRQCRVTVLHLPVAL
jgi:pyrimidine deaminase RibD-like protein